MIPFRRTRKQKDQSVEKRLKNIEDQIEKLANKSFENRIHVETVHVHDPNLESLTFSLDKLNIDELSGALNIGNNFTPTVNKQKGRRHKGNNKKGQRGTGASPSGKKDLGGESVTFDGNVHFEKTDQGFRFTR